jgi:hypothetical protein
MTLNPKPYILILNCKKMERERGRGEDSFFFCKKLLLSLQELRKGEVRLGTEKYRVQKYEGVGFPVFFI